MIRVKNNFNLNKNTELLDKSYFNILYRLEGHINILIVLYFLLFLFLCLIFSYSDLQYSLRFKRHTRWALIHRSLTV